MYNSAGAKSMTDTDTPLVSIVIPTYNHGHFLNRMLDSLRDQTYPHWEAIIVNNYSEDNTIQIIQDFADPRVHLVNFANNGLIAASRNEAIQRAQGEYIAFLDSDDWWMPKKLEISIAHLQSGADIVFHDLWRASKDHQTIFWKKCKSYQPNRRTVYADLLTKASPLFNSSVVVRASILREVGGLSTDTNLITTEDFDLWLRIAKITDQFERINDCLGYYWLGGGNTTEPGNSRQAERYVYVYNQHLPNLNAEDRCQAEGMLAFNCARVYRKSGQYHQASDLLKSCLSSKIPLKYRFMAFFDYITLGVS
jgi:glycosyltransferase involved in cell wall biosynthesis